MMESKNNNIFLLPCRTDRTVIVYTFMNKSAYTVAAVPNFCCYTHTPGPRHSAEQSTSQVTGFSYTFFSTYGTQSQKRSPSLSQTLSLKSTCTAYGIIFKICTRTLCVQILMPKRRNTGALRFLVALRNDPFSLVMFSPVLKIYLRQNFL